MEGAFPQVSHGVALTVNPHLSLFSYSYLSASTGFLLAALYDCQLTVSNAIIKATTPANANTHQLMLIR